jgi:hypothetical protein
MNGWQSGQSQFAGDAIPAWAVRNGVVYLSRSVDPAIPLTGEHAPVPLLVVRARSDGAYGCPLRWLPACR